jgi:microcystin degradation protein MlrC
MTSRRKFLQQAGATIATVGSGLTAGTFISIQKLFAGPGNFEPKRIFYARFSHETNTFHPVRTTSFRISETTPRMLNAWKENDFSIVPGISASPAGGGTVEEAPCREAMRRILDSLREAMPVDAVFLGLHGAMFAEGIGPAETVLVGMVRELVGPDIPIACTFDLHGNIPSRLGNFGDILVGLKTAPHTDAVETAELTGRILTDTLLGKVKPVSYVLPVPIIVQGEKAMTTSEPFGSLVEEARRVEKEGITGYENRILAATLFVGCAWTDSPDTGMSVMITADGSREAARAAAVHLARKIWDARRQFSYGCETAQLEEGISRALAASESTVFLTDSGDNVTASTPGDLPLVLRYLVEQKVTSAVVVCINDTDAVNRCFGAGEGSTLRLSIGATIEKRYGPPFEADVTVVRLIREPRMAVIRCNGVEAVLSDGPRTFRSPGQFEQCGIDPLSRKIVVVKMGYLYPQLTEIAPRHIMLMTPGAGDMRIESLTYTRRRKPLYPFEPDMRFDPAAR